MNSKAWTEWKKRREIKNGNKKIDKMSKTRSMRNEISQICTTIENSFKHAIVEIYVEKLLGCQKSSTLQSSTTLDTRTDIRQNHASFSTTTTANTQYSSISKAAEPSRWRQSFYIGA
jgi:hypothetical protein